MKPQVLEENVGKFLHDLSIGRYFITMIQKYRRNKRLINPTT